MVIKHETRGSRGDKLMSLEVPTIVTEVLASVDLISDPVKDF
jgi:hypothetical protein